jgi:hypothetical protein
MSYLVIFLLGAAAGAYAAYNLGWNAAVRLYEARDVARARERAEQDRR